MVKQHTRNNTYYIDKYGVVHTSREAAVAANQSSR